MAKILENRSNIFPRSFAEAFRADFESARMSESKAHTIELQDNGGTIVEFETKIGNVSWRVGDSQKGESIANAVDQRFGGSFSFDGQLLTIHFMDNSVLCVDMG